MNRRKFVQWLSASAAVSALSGCATSGSTTGSSKAGRVVVIGGGYGGATAARYIKLWNPAIDVVMVEQNPVFISCPLSNRVLAGTINLQDLTRDYDTLQKYGVIVVQDVATAIDPARRTVSLKRGQALNYDRLIVSPGVEFLYAQLPGLNNAAAQQTVLHAWKAGPQTLALRKQLEAMPDGGVYALFVPKAPYRCPPGPYERACQVAWYFKNAKPKSKVLVFDANPEITSKKGLFGKAFAERYGGIIEYRPNSELTDVDPATNTARLTFEDVKADVLNVVPPQAAGAIARQAGLVTSNDRWCDVDWRTMESTAQKNIHVLGDATLSAPAMPKSGHMANSHAKVCAAAVVAQLAGQPINDSPMMTNTCYSFISGNEVVHIASVHAFNAEKKTMMIVEGSGGVSPAPSKLEGEYAEAWGRNIWADMLAS